VDEVGSGAKAKVLGEVGEDEPAFTAWTCIGTSQTPASREEH